MNYGVRASTPNAIFGRQFNRHDFEWLLATSREALLAPPPWAPSFEHALSVRADALTAPPAAPPRPCVAHRRRLGCRVGALADSFATGARAIYCSARRRCRRSRAHSLARTCAAARRASPCGSVPARAAAPHGSTDCPRSPLVPAPDRLHAADVETDLPTATARRLAIFAYVGNVRVEAVLSSKLSPLLRVRPLVHALRGWCMPLRAPLTSCSPACSAATTPRPTSRRPRRLCSSRPCSSAPACSRSSARSSSALCSWSP